MAELYTTLISYDIDKKHPEVRNSLINDYGFKATITGSNGTVCYLPNTTLVKANTTKTIALDTLKKVCKTQGATLIRAIATECSNWQAVQGEDF